MNERIKELWGRAAESTAAYPSGQNNYWETQVNFMEKFAELIVKECAELVESQHTWITSVAASALIRQHFGVEE